ncbi:hypothetical protein B0H19DRAFT_1376934 [Mycena capillaripes]|nr:hypothetical protein B0H19DRAFT_1376934 [Mycena capillaripes]
MSDPFTNNSSLTTNKKGGSSIKSRGLGSSERDASSAEGTSSTTKTSSTTTKTSNSSGATISTASAFNSTTTSTGNSTSGRQLSQCALTLRETILTIEWTDGAAREVSVNLNQYVAYTSGVLRWVSRGQGGFRSTCQEKSIRLDGTDLIASCREAHSGNYQPVRLSLNGCITFNPLTNLFEPSELEATSSIPGAKEIVASSTSLLDVTLISSFNLAKFLGDPGFQKVMTGVAERAENDAQDRRLAVMSQMNEEVEEINKEVNDLQKRLESVASRAQKATKDMKTQLDAISSESAQRFEREMTTLINSVAKMTMNAIYAQIRELTVLSVDQQTAYETNWPLPPPKTEGPTASAH